MGPAHVNMHFAEPLLAPVGDWPKLRSAASVDSVSPAALLSDISAPAELGRQPVFIIGDIPQHQQVVVLCNMSKLEMLLQVRELPGRKILLDVGFNLLPTPHRIRLQVMETGIRFNL